MTRAHVIPYQLAKQRALKNEDAWTEVLIIDPITLPISYFLAKYAFIHPLHITLLGFFSRIIAAISFYHGLLMYGALFTLLGMIFDGIDGKLARIQQKTLVLHGVVDFLLDHLAFACMIYGLIVYAIRLEDVRLLILFIFWITTYFILLAITSTYWRLRLEIGKKYTSNETENVIGDSISRIKSNGVRTRIGSIIKVYFKYRRKLRNRYRLRIFPSTIEAEFLLFIASPFLGQTFGLDIVHTLAALSVLCFIPDMLTNVAETLLLIPIANNQKVT